MEAFDGNAIKNALIGIIIGAFAAGLSAAYNGAIAPTLNKLMAKGNGGGGTIES